MVNGLLFHQKQQNLWCMCDNRQFSSWLKPWIWKIFCWWSTMQHLSGLSYVLSLFGVGLVYIRATEVLSGDWCWVSEGGWLYCTFWGGGILALKWQSLFRARQSQISNVVIDSGRKSFLIRYLVMDAHATMVSLDWDRLKEFSGINKIVHD